MLRGSKYSLSSWYLFSRRLGVRYEIRIDRARPALMEIIVLQLQAHRSNVLLALISFKQVKSLAPSVLLEITVLILDKHRPLLASLITTALLAAISKINVLLATTAQTALRLIPVQLALTTLLSKKSRHRKN